MNVSIIRNWIGISLDVESPTNISADRRPVVGVDKYQNNAENFSFLESLQKI